MAKREHNKRLQRLGRARRGAHVPPAAFNATLVGRAGRALDRSIANLPHPSRARWPAGILYLQLGSWPPWVSVIVAAAAANPRVFFYFAGPPLPGLAGSGCSNCARLALSNASLAGRIQAQLGIPLSGTVPLSSTLSYGAARKVCDLKPMWGALLPELSARHSWIGYADSDILLGNLSAEVDRLRGDEELVVPPAYFPQPLANGNLLLMATSRKMIRAFERSSMWREALLMPEAAIFDEWWSELGVEGHSMYGVFQSMLLHGELRAAPMSRLLLQDSIFIPDARRGGRYPGVERYADRIDVRWERGRLVAERVGACMCPQDTFQIGLTVCAQCLQHPGRIFKGQRIEVRLEALGFHFQQWKTGWNETATACVDRGRRTRRGWRQATPRAYRLTPEGFTCEM